MSAAGGCFFEEVSGSLYPFYPFSRILRCHVFGCCVSCLCWFRPDFLFRLDFEVQSFVRFCAEVCFSVKLLLPACGSLGSLCRFCLMLFWCFCTCFIRRFLTFSGGCRRFFSGDFCFSGCGCTVFINRHTVYGCKLCAVLYWSAVWFRCVWAAGWFGFCQLHFSKNRSVFSLYLNVRRQVFKRCPPKTMRTQDS